MNAKILLALLLLLLGAVGGYFAIESRDGAEETETTAGTDVPASGAEKPAEAAKAADVEEAVAPAEPPTFELVRVEPTGELVAAGLAAANSLVELLAGEQVLAQTKATSGGEWALVLDTALAVGSHDLVLRATPESGEPVYGDHVAVVIPENGETPLVAITSEGKPSRIVQKPAEAEGGESLAAGTDMPGGDEATAGEGEQRLAMAGDTASDQPAQETAAAPVGQDVPAGADDTGAADTAAEDTAPGQGGETQVEESANAQPQPGEEQAAASGTSADSAGTAAPDTDGQAQPSDRTAGSEGGASEEQKSAGEQMTAADSGEAAGSESGSEPDAAGDQPDAVSGEETADDASPTQELAAAGPGAASTDVAGTDETGPAAGTREGPEGTAGSEAGSAGEQSAATETAALPGDAGAGSAPAGAASDPSAAAKDDTDLTIETVEVEEPGRLMMSGEAGPDQPVRLYVNNEQVGEVQADATGNWFLTASREMPPGQYEVRADAVGGGGDVQARSAVRFERVRVAFAGGGDTSPEGASGSAEVATQGARVDGLGSGAGATGTGAAGDASVVMINRGDNLWTIARKLYGRGVRYTVIYDANRKQIRDPSLIYPGQVFTVPIMDDAPQGTDQAG